MLVDPNNRFVAETLEGKWNEKLRALAKAREESVRGRHEDQLVLDHTVRRRLVAMTTDFRNLWADPGTFNRERKESDRKTMALRVCEWVSGTRETACTGV
jgi:hypothetical protein